MLFIILIDDATKSERRAKNTTKWKMEWQLGQKQRIGGRRVPGDEPRARMEEWWKRNELCQFMPICVLLTLSEYSTLCDCDCDATEQSLICAWWSVSVDGVAWRFVWGLDWAVYYIIWFICDQTTMHPLLFRFIVAFTTGDSLTEQPSRFTSELCLVGSVIMTGFSVKSSRKTILNMFNYRKWDLDGGSSEKTVDLWKVSDPSSGTQWKIRQKKKNTPPGGLEPPTFRSLLGLINSRTR